MIPLKELAKQWDRDKTFSNGEVICKLNLFTVLQKWWEDIPVRSEKIGSGEK